MCVLTGSILDDVWNDHIWHTASCKKLNILLKHYYYLFLIRNVCATHMKTTHTHRGYQREGGWGIVKNAEDQINGDGRFDLCGKYAMW